MSTNDALNHASIVRPELFITPEVCGITIPVTIQDEDGIHRVWKTYLQWTDGAILGLHNLIAKEGGYLRTCLTNSM